jgi:hypothetical protein
MSPQRSRLVRVMSEEEIVSITGTLPYATSIGRNCIGGEVHRSRISGPSQTKEFRLPQLAIFLPHADHPVRVRHQVGDEVTTKDVGKDAVTIAPCPPQKCFRHTQRHVMRGAPDCAILSSDVGSFCFF